MTFQRLKKKRKKEREREEIDISFTELKTQCLRKQNPLCEGYRTFRRKLSWSLRYPLWQGPPELCPSHWTSSRCFLGKLAKATFQRKPSSPCLSLQPWTWCEQSEEETLLRHREWGAGRRTSKTWRCAAVRWRTTSLWAEDDNTALPGRGYKATLHPSPNLPQVLRDLCFSLVCWGFFNHPNTTHSIICN